MGALCSKSPQGPPEWNSRSPKQIGCDKQVFVGTFGSGRRRVSTVIHVPNGNVQSQFENEVAVLSRLGAHPHLMTMIHSGVTDAGSYMALEDVQCELQWLVKHYMFAKENVPRSMARAMAVDLSHAIDHMHNHKILHRDIKMESVLVTKGYDAKLVDMGTACRLGLKEERWIWNPKEHRAYEVCHGNLKLGPEVDCWGIGVMLHQMYQFRSDIIDSSRDVPMLRPGRPSIAQPMDPFLQEAMVSLLQVNTALRWTTESIRHRFVDHEVPGEHLEWVPPIAPEETRRDFLCRYRMTGVPPLAYAVLIDSKAKHLFDKTLDQVDLGGDNNILLLLVDSPKQPGPNARRTLEKTPNKDTVIKEGSWLYFCLPLGEDTEVAIDRLERRLFPAWFKDKEQRDSGQELICCRAGSKSAAKQGSIFVKPMAFGLEFDCFTFPDHVPVGSILGPSKGYKGPQLAFRNRFGLNLAGIVRRGASEPTWFPNNTTQVGPGDLGLVLRCPRPDGRTEPTVHDCHLAPLVSRESFERITAEEPVHPEDALTYNI